MLNYALECRHRPGTTLPCFLGKWVAEASRVLPSYTCTPGDSEGICGEVHRYKLLKIMLLHVEGKCQLDSNFHETRACYEVPTRKLVSLVAMFLA
jgi:hypothetical protein